MKEMKYTDLLLHIVENSAFSKSKFVRQNVFLAHSVEDPCNTVVSVSPLKYILKISGSGHRVANVAPGSSMIL